MERTKQSVVPAASLLVVLAAMPLAAQQAKRVLTLADAVSEALLKNDRIINQHDTGERAGLSVRAARSAFSPKIVPNMQGSFGQTDIAGQTYRLDVTKQFTTGTSVRVGGGTSSSQVPSLTGTDDVRFYNSDTTLLLSQPLLKGFGPAATRRSLTLAELNQATSARDQSLLEQQVAIDVATTYYRVVSQEALIKVARQGFDRARQLRDASEAKLGAGLVSQLDVLRAQQLVSQAQLQLFDAESSAEDARDQLRFLMGSESGTPFEIIPDIPKTVEDVTPDDAIARAMATRPDLQTAIASANDADRAISYARNQLKPQVDLNLALTRRETADSLPRSFGLDKFQFATFFTISMPVDRTPQLVEFQSAIIDRDRHQRDVEMLRRRIADDVRRQVRQRDRVVRNLAAAEANVQLAQQEVDIAKFRYERGLSNNLDVVTAQTNLLNVETARIVTLADLAVARLTLRAAIGALDPRKDFVDATVPVRAEHHE